MLSTDTMVGYGFDMIFEMAKKCGYDGCVEWKLCKITCQKTSVTDLFYSDFSFFE